jgi:hypothetical protein
MSGAVTLLPISHHVLDKANFTFEALHVYRTNYSACFDHLHFYSGLTFKNRASYI